MPRPSWRRLLLHAVDRACCLARLSTGSRSPASTAIVASTVSSWTSVNPTAFVRAARRTTKVVLSHITTRSAAPSRVFPTRKRANPASAGALGYISAFSSGYQFDEVRFDPHRMTRFGPKFNINTLVESPNAIPLSNHTHEKLFRTKLILDAGSILARAILDHLDDVT